MTKKNTEISVGTMVESMEEAIGVTQGEIGELKGEFTSLKECLQQIFLFFFIGKNHLKSIY